MDDVAEIPLTQNRVALVDANDAGSISAFKWTLSRNGSKFYAIRIGRTPEGGLRRIYMHRQLMAPPRGLFVDHRDGDGLNNTRSNLRLATRSDNQRNGPSFGRTSRYKGVSLHAASGKWQGHIKADLSSDEERES